MGALEKFIALICEICAIKFSTIHFDKRLGKRFAKSSRGGDSSFLKSPIIPILENAVLRSGVGRQGFLTLGF
jgi:hypothetical protein